MAMGNEEKLTSQKMKEMAGKMLAGDERKSDQGVRRAIKSLPVYR
jgi:hypothetical protein